MSNPPKRIGIFGGTFNPPHTGHILSAEKFLSALSLDELYIIPTFIPPHKDPSDTTSALDRLKMCELAFSGIDRAKVLDVEIKRGGKSYTYLTLEELSEDGIELYFLCGTDMFLTLDEWKLPERIFELCTVVLSRRELDESTEIAISRKAEIYRVKYRAKIIIINGDVIDVSSTEIRSDISLASSRDYLPSSVFDYAVKNNLYGLGQSEFGIGYIRGRLLEFMGSSRMSHTLGVEKMAAFIGSHILPEKVTELRIAALLHDIAKEQGREKQIEFISIEGASLSEEELMCDACLHSYAAPALIKREFLPYVTENILSACFNHTTGRSGMSLFDEIIFLADYIEPTRRYEKCIELRELLEDKFSKAEAVEGKIKALHECTLIALNNTVEFLSVRNLPISPATKNTINYISALI